LDEFLEKALTLENIVAVAPLDESAMIVNPVFWLFAADKAHPRRRARRRVTGDAEFAAAPHKAFLAPPPLFRLSTCGSEDVARRVHSSDLPGDIV
jgi:hypothetical protein